MRYTLAKYSLPVTEILARYWPGLGRRLFDWQMARLPRLAEVVQAANSENYLRSIAALRDQAPVTMAISLALAVWEDRARSARRHWVYYTHVELVQGFTEFGNVPVEVARAMADVYFLVFECMRSGLSESETVARIEHSPEYKRLRQVETTKKREVLDNI